LTTFTELGLAEPLLKALAEEGYVTPTPIQAQAIPNVLAGRDLLGIAQTGTGKTAAFALPILHRLAADRRKPASGTCRVLVLSPTRELASQIADSFRTYGRNLGFSIAVVFGGVPHGAQIKAIGAGLDVLVATPGRLVDHMDARVLNLGVTEYLVLDEVDQMLDLGFVKAIRKIVGRLPAKRSNLFFSATMPPEIGKLAADLLSDPVEVRVAPVATTVERVHQSVILVEARRKRDILVELFRNDAAMSRTIVFTRTKRGADKVSQALEAAGIASAAIHGNKSQNQRERALEAFRVGKVRVMVATDIAARGIDIDSVTHVINYELPEVPESYVHRIGRTARAGAEGRAISLCDAEEHDLLRNIQKLTRQQIPATDRRSEEGAESISAAPEREETRGPRRPRGAAPAKLAKPAGHAHQPQHRHPRDQQGSARRHQEAGEKPATAPSAQPSHELSQVAFLASPGQASSQPKQRRR
jgi:ATP-dependent RNA helicase RhlE